MAIAAPDGHGAHLDPAALTEDDERALAAWLADPAHPKVLHDAKGPMHAFGARGFTLAGLVCDTALAAYLALPGQRTFDLADLTLRYVGEELGEEPEDGQLTLDGSAERDVATGLVLRAKATLALAAALDADLDRREAGALLRELELPLVSVLAKMEHTGIAADIDHFAGMSATLHGEVKAAEQAAFAVVGHEFNLGSPKQLQEVLFNELSLPKTKRIKTGYTTDSEALTSLLAQTEHPVLEHLLRHRDVSKLMTIVDSLIPMAGEDGRIHTTFNQTIAATGRLSSTDPNLQNIPIRSELGRQIRRGFVVGPGYECLLTADYSQIELRIMAHLSGDEALIAAFESGHDFHAATASRVFGLPPEEVGPELRAKIKAMNYGLAYGLSAFGLSQQLRISTDEARVLMEDYFKEFGGVRDYLHEVVGPGPDGRLHRDHDGPPPLPARPDLGQPAAPRDGRTDGAERADPGLGRGRDQGGHAGRRQRAVRRGAGLPDAAPGPRRAAHRGGPRRVRPGPRAGLRRHGRRRRAARAARRLRRDRPDLGRRRPLTAWPAGFPGPSGGTGYRYCGRS